MLISEIRKARQAAGCSQRALASRIGVDPQVVKRLEAGTGSVATLVSVMAALEFSLTGLAPGRSLSDKLRNRRRALSLSVAGAAVRASLSRATVASLERGGGSVRSLQRLLDAIAPAVRRRAPERAYWGADPKNDRDSRFTPAAFMATIYDAFGPIDLDPCGHRLSPVVAHRRITLCEGGDGLSEDWAGRLAFVNPPFSQLLVWLRRAHDQWRRGNVETVVCLVPVRTDSGWFHQTLSADADIFLLQGRVRFLDARGKGQSTPFSLMLLTLGASPEQKARYSEATPGFWLARG